MPGPSEMKHQEFEWQISSKVKETHDTYTYTLLPVSESQRFDFEIGQFVTLSAFLIRPTNQEEVKRIWLIVLIQSHRHHQGILLNLQ